MPLDAEDEAELSGILASKVGKQARARLSELEVGFLDASLDEVEANYSRHQAHDSLVDLCVSAFGPESRASKELGYSFVSAEPLVEKGVKNFDCLIYNSGRKWAIFVECKSAAAAPGRDINDLRRGITAVHSEKTYIETQIGDRIDHTEFALCAPAELATSFARSLSNPAPGPSAAAEDTPILLWSVNKFFETSLQLVTNVPGRSVDRSQHADSDLTRLLGSAVRLTPSEVVVKAYPSSHPLRLIQEAVTNCIIENMRRSRDLHILYLHDIRTFFQDPTNLPHYACSEIGRRMAETVVADLLGKDLATHTERVDELRLLAEGKSLKTILRNLDAGYRSASAHSLARRKASSQLLDEFRKTQHTL